DGTSGSDFSNRQSTCVSVTSPLPPSFTANKPLGEAWHSIQARSIQRFDPDVFIVHRAVRVVGLKRDRPGPADLAAGAFGPSGPVRRLCPLHHLFVVHLDDDGDALDDDVLGEP